MSNLRITSRTPLRVTLGGGGSDLPWYANEYGGLVITSAINQYTYVTLEKASTDLITLKNEVTRTVDIPLKLNDFNTNRILLNYDLTGIDITSHSYHYKDKGLGFSGCYSIGLLKVVNQFLLGKTISPNKKNIQMAFDIESELGGGIQDPAVAEYGGIIIIRISEGYKYQIFRLELDKNIQTLLNESILFFDTKIKQSEYLVLGDQGRRKNDSYFHAIKAIGEELLNALKTGDIESLGKLTNDHWNLKKKTSPMISNESSKYVEKAIKLGANGAKITGAGGGYLLVFSNDKNIRKKIISNINLNQTKLEIGVNGSEIIEDPNWDKIGGVYGAKYK